MREWWCNDDGEDDDADDDGSGGGGGDNDDGDDDMLICVILVFWHNKLSRHFVRHQTSFQVLSIRKLCSVLWDFLAPAVAKQK